jgi:thiamine biosynthesis lipoprotein
MGNIFTISIICENKELAEISLNEAVDEIKRIENLLSTYSDKSETELINKNSGIMPVIISPETFQLIKRAQKISSITQGAFDLSYGSIDKNLWNFNQNMTELPSKKIAQKMVSLINYQNIELDETNTTIFLKNKGMRIGFGGIGKGYAADKAKELLIKKGIISGVVNASGDLCTWGKQLDNTDWTIGIAHPDQKNQVFSTLKISNLAVATSGNYEKFVLIDGKKYSHTIDPKTGLPIQGIKSVTIISPSAELSDALATPVTVMGISVGLDLINQLNQVACIIVDDNNVVYTSKNINKL